ncbi:MAG: nitronate monooxygenase [Microthrixaceae bacterium]
MSAHPALSTPACELFGVRHPIVQTGMGWVSGARLTAATAEAGALGILASATMTLEELGAAIERVRRRTSNPFGVNLLPSQPDAAERIGLIIDRGVRVASFAAAPRAEQVARLRDSGVATVVTVGAPRHAEKVLAMGVDAVIAQGGEGGGHTGSVPTSLLVPGVVEATRGSSLVVLAAGGMHEGSSLVAALAWGAHGIAMGTRFLLTAESQVPDHVKDVYLRSGLNSTVVTSAIDGAPQRVIRTEVIDALESSRGPRRLVRGRQRTRVREAVRHPAARPVAHRTQHACRPGAQPVPGRARRERSDDDQGIRRRRRPGGGDPAHRPGRGQHRGPAQRGRAGRGHRRRCLRDPGAPVRPTGGRCGCRERGGELMDLTWSDAEGGVPRRVP